MTSLTGLWRMVRLVVRRDRLRLPLWIVGLTAFVLVSAASLPPLYSDQAAIDSYVTLFDANPAIVAMAGPGHGFDEPNIGVILVNEVQLFGCIGMALMSIFLVNRHTRAEEDVERAEVLRSSVVGRHAPTAAAIAVVTAANLVVAAACGVGFLALAYPVAGSIALAASLAACGLVFTALTAVAAQIASGSRSTLGMATGFLGLAFALRAFGDINDSWLVWSSPIGWSQAVRVDAHEAWWTLGLSAVAAAGVTVGAFWLSTRRDLGSGLLPTRPGPATAARALLRPVGLAFRLQRGFLLGWSIGLFLLGLVYGSIGEQVEQMVAENPTFADFLAQLGDADIVDAYLTTSVSVLAIMSCGFAVSATLRLRAEERAGRAESVLAAPVARSRWAASHLLVASFGSVCVLVAAGLGLGISYGLVVGDAGQVPRLVGASLVYLPGVMVMAGVAMVLFGFVPDLALTAWGAFAGVVLLGLFADLLGLPEWARLLSPLAHLPEVPARGVEPLPLLVLAAIALSLIWVGLQAFDRRDLRS